MTDKEKIDTLIEFSDEAYELLINLWVIAKNSPKNQSPDLETKYNDLVKRQNNLPKKGQ